MNQPGALFNGIPPGDDDIPRRIRELERQVQMLACARTLEAASIGQGGITVSGGNIAIKAGGTLTVENASGAAVPLAQLAFGAEGATDNTARGFNVPANPASGVYWSDTVIGPEVSVKTSAGKLMVLAFANLQSQANGGTVCVEVLTTAGAVVVPVWDPTAPQPNQVYNVTPNYQGTGWPVAAAGMVQLAAGSYRLRMRYGAGRTGQAVTAGCQQRTLLVLPF